MKKKYGSRIIKVLGRVINVRKWFDWERMKSFSVALKNAIKGVFVYQPPPQDDSLAESFDSIAKKLNLSESDLLIKQKALFRLAMLMLFLALLVLGYAGYQLFSGTFKAFIVSLAVTAIALALAFRYHFWYYQIKSRKLGCTFQQWYRNGLLGEKE